MNNFFLIRFSVPHVTTLYRPCHTFLLCKICASLIPFLYVLCHTELDPFALNVHTYVGTDTIGPYMDVMALFESDNWDRNEKN